MVHEVLEFDIVNSNVVSGSHDVEIFVEGTAHKGSVIGSLQMLCSHLGRAGGKSRHSSSGDGTGFTVKSVLLDKTHRDDRARSRPKFSVRGRPLIEASAQLSDAMQSMKRREDSTSNKNSFVGEPFVLSYDDISMLFKKFQGEKKGTIRYAGQLLQLLNVPSSSKCLKLFTRLFNACRNDFEKVPMRGRYISFFTFIYRI